MSDATRGAGESCLGRVWVLLTALVVFATPLWVMLTAGLMQVFPELMGLDIVVDDQGTRRVVTLYSVAVAGTLSGGLVAGFLGLMTVVGGSSWVAGKVQGLLLRENAKRFEALAGDAVMPGAELRTATQASLDASTEPIAADATASLPDDVAGFAAYSGPPAVFAFLGLIDAAPEPRERMQDFLQSLARADSTVLVGLSKAPAEDLQERLEAAASDEASVAVGLKALAAVLGPDDRREFLQKVILAQTSLGPLDEAARSRIDALASELSS